MTSVRFIKQRGLAMVEFAIAAPVLLLMGFLAADIARAYALKNTLLKAVSSAARYVAKQPCSDTDAVADATKIWDQIAESGGFKAETKPDVEFLWMATANPGVVGCDSNVVVKACKDPGGDADKDAKYICVKSEYQFPLLSPALYRWYGGSGIGDDYGNIPLSAFSLQRLTP